jgi:hypothetical protein
MEEFVKKILEEKALEVSNYLDSVNVAHTYKLKEYGINFFLHREWVKHNLSLSYSPNKRRWTPYSTDDWVKKVIIPLVQPLLEGGIPLTRKQVAVATNKVAATFSARVHFAEAYACFSILEPFAEENIDFSVIYDFAQRGVRLVLSDPRCVHLDRSSLLEVLEDPPKSDFLAAKEYLSQCLMLCGVIEN